MTFQTIKRGKGDFTFLIVPRDAGQVAICDSEGFNYGSYFDFKSFEDYAERNGGFEACRLGKAQVLIQPLRV